MNHALLTILALTKVPCLGIHRGGSELLLLHAIRVGVLLMVPIYLYPVPDAPVVLALMERLRRLMAHVLISQCAQHSKKAQASLDLLTSHALSP